VPSEEFLNFGGKAESLVASWQALSEMGDIHAQHDHASRGYEQRLQPYEILL
jgi:hypothetical protein